VRVAAALAASFGATSVVSPRGRLPTIVPTGPCAVAAWKISPVASRFFVLTAAMAWTEELTLPRNIGGGIALALKKAAQLPRS